MMWIVNHPSDRFIEDPNRVPRLIGQCAELQFGIDPRAQESLSDPLVVDLLKTDTGSRVGNELLRLLSAKDPTWVHWGIWKWFDFGLADIWLPELKRLQGMKQNYYHSHSVLGHTLLTLKAAVGQPLEVVIAALFHDIGKGTTQTWSKRGVAYGYNFYGHHMKSHDICRKIFRRFHFGRNGTEKYTFNTEEILHLIWNHMGAANGVKFSNILRKLGVTEFGPHMLDYSLALTLADAKGRQFSGCEDEYVIIYKEITDAYPDCKREVIYPDMSDVIERLSARYTNIKIKLAAKPPLSLKDMGMNGMDIMEAFGYSPGPEVGQFLQYHFNKVLDEIGDGNDNGSANSD
jgi:tRNA nucleotidyltransferase/poly(A) polymerase